MTESCYHQHPSGFNQEQRRASQQQKGGNQHQSGFNQSQINNVLHPISSTVVATSDEKSGYSGANRGVQNCRNAGIQDDLCSRAVPLIYPVITIAQRLDISHSDIVGHRRLSIIPESTVFENRENPDAVNPSRRRTLASLRNERRESVMANIIVIMKFIEFIICLISLILCIKIFSNLPRSLLDIIIAYFLMTLAALGTSLTTFVMGCRSEVQTCSYEGKIIVFVVSHTLMTVWALGLTYFLMNETLHTGRPVNCRTEGISYYNCSTLTAFAIMSLLLAVLFMIEIYAYAKINGKKRIGVYNAPQTQTSNEGWVSPVQTAGPPRIVAKHFLAVKAPITSTPVGMVPGER